MARSRRQDSQPSQDSSAALAPDSGIGETTGNDLNFNEARAALELVLAELQASDLDVEAMAGLYQRGRAYAQRCEAILAQVEQEVLIWDEPANPELAPVRYDPGPDAT
jgi:exodeoxyribonuclease VII small subunit